MSSSTSSSSENDATHGGEGEEFWDDADQDDLQQHHQFSHEELAVVYGKSVATAVSDTPELLHATVNVKTFGKMESLASKDANSLLPRLRSIHLDATTFVSRVRASFPNYSAFANLRNGLWYFERPADGECRFKSTDGHSQSWSFFVSRANLACAARAIESNGLLIVDSTRFGKAYPDAFNRTVPLWCAVINRAMGFENDEIVLPPWLEEFERSRFTKEQLDGWATEVGDLMRKSGAKFTSSRPLKPYWIANDHFAWGQTSSAGLIGLVDRVDLEANHVIPIICVSSSAVISPMKHRERFSWNYVPGAADDEENWSFRLTPQLFWTHHRAILECTHSDKCRDFVLSLLETDAKHKSAETNTTSMFEKMDIADRLQVWWSKDGKKAGSPAEKSMIDVTWIKGQDKSWGRRNPDCWQKFAIPQTLMQFHRLMTDTTMKDPCIILALDSETGLTLALAVLAAFYDEKLDLNLSGNAWIDKQILKTREAILVSKCSTTCVAISRRLFKEVAEFFVFRKWQPAILSSATDRKQ